MNISETIQRLIDGNARFIKDRLDGKLQNSNRRKELVGGQDPYAIILSCADSRVVPELIFDVGLGELFVVRVAGNIANSSSIASIEYAVIHCGSKVIMVMGHQSCGAVTAAVTGGDNGYNLNHLLAHIAPSLSASKEGAEINDIVKINAELNAKELLSRSDIIKNYVDNGDVKIVPAYYHLDSGRIELLNFKDAIL